MGELKHHCCGWYEIETYISIKYHCQLQLNDSFTLHFCWTSVSVSKIRIFHETRLMTPSIVFNRQKALLQLVRHHSKVESTDLADGWCVPVKVACSILRSKLHEGFIKHVLRPYDLITCFSMVILLPDKYPANSYKLEICFWKKNILLKVTAKKTFLDGFYVTQ